jgi:hypothetical protein
MVIVSKIIFYLAINIPWSIGFIIIIIIIIICCVLKWQCINASCYIININPLILMYCVRRGEENFKMTTFIIFSLDKHLNEFLLYYNF